MKRFRSLFILTILTLNLGVFNVYADNVIGGSPPASQEQTITAPDSEREYYNPLEGMDGVMNNAQNQVSNSGAVQVVSSSIAIFMKFIFGIIPSLILGQTALEILLLVFAPIKVILDKTTKGGSRSGGGDLVESGGSSSGGGINAFLSDDYKAVAGSSSGEGGGNGKSLTWQKIKNYTMHRAKLIIISVLVLTVISIPILFDLAMAITQIFIKGLQGVVDWLAGVAS